MKLRRLNEIPIITPSQAQLQLALLESMWGDLLAGGKAKAQSLLQRNSSLIRSDPVLKGLVSDAKSMQVSLLSSDASVAKWWGRLFDHFNIPGDSQQDLLMKMLSEIKPQINRAKETPDSVNKQKRLLQRLQQQGASQQELDDLAAELRRRRRMGRAAADAASNESISAALDKIDIMEAGLDDYLAGGDSGGRKSRSARAIGLLGKGGRDKAGASFVLRSNNVQVAALAINILMGFRSKHRGNRAADTPEQHIGAPPVQEPEAPPAQGQGQREHPDIMGGLSPEQLSQNEATMLWKIINVGKADKQLVQDTMQRIKERGYELVWQGKKVKGRYPVGDKPPRIRPAKTP